MNVEITKVEAAILASCLVVAVLSFALMLGHVICLAVLV